MGFGALVRWLGRSGQGGNRSDSQRREVDIQDARLEAGWPESRVTRGVSLAKYDPGHGAMLTS